MSQTPLQILLVCIALVCATGTGTQASYVNDSYYHTAFIRQNCACSSPIHPQARFCGADLVIVGILKSVRHVACNFSTLPSKVARSSVISCTDLHFIAADVLHSHTHRAVLHRAVERVRKAKKLVITIPKSNVSTCNFDVLPSLRETYIVSANFLGKRFFTYNCYHLFENWRALTGTQRKAYTKHYYENNCQCQIVQSSFYVRFDWPRQPASTPRSRQCWWQPGSTDATSNFDRTSFCKFELDEQADAQCQWRALARQSARSREREREPLPLPLPQSARRTTSPATTMSNEIPHFGYLED